MTRIPKLGQLRLDFLAMSDVTLFRPARGCIHFLLETCAGRTFALDFEERTFLGCPQSLFCQISTGPQLFELARKIRPSLHQCPVACADLILLSRDFRLERPARCVTRGLSLLKIADTHLRGQQCAGALFQRGLGAAQFRLQ